MEEKKGVWYKYYLVQLRPKSFKTEQTNSPLRQFNLDGRFRRLFSPKSLSPNH